MVGTYTRLDVLAAKNMVKPWDVITYFDVGSPEGRALKMKNEQSGVAENSPSGSPVLVKAISSGHATVVDVQGGEIASRSITPQSIFAQVYMKEGQYGGKKRTRRARRSAKKTLRRKH